jgi:hypothetical protein
VSPTSGWATPDLEASRTTRARVRTSRHEISYVDREGHERIEQGRVAGPCLIWERPVAGG